MASSAASDEQADLVPLAGRAREHGAAADPGPRFGEPPQRAGAHGARDEVLLRDRELAGRPALANLDEHRHGDVLERRSRANAA